MIDKNSRGRFSKNGCSKIIHQKGKTNYGGCPKSYYICLTTKKKITIVLRGHRLKL